MPLSWNEMRTRASAFVLEWKDRAPNVKEEAEAQTFENEFLAIFGVDRKKVALFEKKVKLVKDGGAGLFGEMTDSADGYIDLFWKGHIMIEMKSPGKNLNVAYEQAKNYANALAQKDIPKAILICDFVNFHYYNLQEDCKLYAFKITELQDYLKLFSDLAGYNEVNYKKTDPVNIEAAENMGRLHDRLKETGYEGHQLEVYLVRLMFCLFADDTGIFEPDHFVKYIIERTNTDGSDLALHIHKIFEILNTPPNMRHKNIDEQLAKFPYINGDLFEEQLGTADFDTKMRETLIDCCTLDWGKISPAVFGAMFQSVMNPDTRHDIGAHYTSEENILKVIHPLFLDGLWDELNKIKSFTSDVRKSRLEEFHNKIAALKFLDPACGCGNFLVISYRELRLLEIEVIKELLRGGEKLLDIEQYIKVNVDQFYGIEILEFPCRVAQTALWLMDHLMNLQIRDEFGQYYIRIPLRTSPSINNQNALPLDWETIVPKTELSYILGNPPFLGYSVMSRVQKAEVENVFENMKNCGTLDYVTAWYKKAAQYIQGTEIEVAFVSTNSICQGEQVPALWPGLINKYGIKINFAHNTFKWRNEARGKAAVYCVIIGFSMNDRTTKKLYHYATITSEPVESMVYQINAYLIEAPMIFIERREEPICKVSHMLKGSSPTDDGNFFLTEKEKNDLLEKDKSLSKTIRPFIGAKEYINKIPRYCIWLKNISPEKYNHSKEIKDRIVKIRQFREKSNRAATLKYANFPSLFSEIRQPNTDYILIPRHSSENRKYIPIGFVSKNVICGDSNMFIPNATLYEFGVITSTMHMAWMRYVCGRLEMRYRYSNVIVYNNFPWPSPTEKQKETIENLAQGVLDARKIFPKLTYADLYNINTAPPDLTKAHQKLDKAVEKAYGREFDDDTQRVAYLFELYQKLSGELFKDEKKRGKGRKVK